MCLNLTRSHISLANSFTIEPGVTLLYRARDAIDSMAGHTGLIRSVRSDKYGAYEPMVKPAFVLTGCRLIFMQMRHNIL